MSAGVQVEQRMDTFPLISVIIPTVRRPRRLREALRSVGEQTYPHVEVVVVNDGGPPDDGLAAEYESAFGRPIHTVRFATNRGLSAARNAGVANSSGTLIALLDDDDRFRPGHLAPLAQALAQDNTAMLAYDDVLIHLDDEGSEDGAVKTIATCRFGLPYDRRAFDHDDFIVPSSTLFRRADFMAIGGFDETMPVCEDWDFLLRLRDRGELRYVPGEIGVDYSLRAVASDNLGSQFDERRRAALDRLSARYGLPHLDPKTFLDVATGLGFPLIPTSAADHANEA